MTSETPETEWFEQLKIDIHFIMVRYVCKDGRQWNYAESIIHENSEGLILNPDNFIHSLKPWMLICFLPEPHPI